MTDLANLIEVVQSATAVLGDAKPTWTESKAHQDFVTDVDLRLQAFFETRLAALTPHIPVLGEESAIHVEMPVDQWWIVDPLDGTGNLVEGLPVVGVSVALVDAHGPRLAAVASPYQRRLWAAERGRGATVNGTPLRQADHTPQLVVVSSGLLDRMIGRSARDDWAALRRIGKIRNLGAQAIHLCGVAEGWFAAALSVEARVWDEAAGGLIAREAGAVWSSRADDLDWLNPIELLSVTQQESIACHPSVAEDLAGIFGRKVRSSSSLRAQP